MAETRPPGSSRFPGGSKIIALVCLLLVILGLLVLADRRDRRPPAPPADVLAGLGETGADWERIGQTVGAPLPLGEDAPLDLAGLPSSGGMTAPRPLATPAPPASPIPVPATAPATRLAEATPVATPVAPAGEPAGSELRPVDYPRLRVAHQAGDVPYLVSILRDEGYQVPGRIYALALVALLPGAAADQGLQEVFEAPGEPLGLRETAAQALLARQREAFGDYLLRVLERPRVASGEDGGVSRLLLLAFQGDRLLLAGRALDRIGARVFELARSGSPTARAVLSFGLGPDRPQDEVRALLEGSPTGPPVAGNLLRFYEAMVSRGRKEFELPLAKLRDQVAAGL